MIELTIDIQEYIIQYLDDTTASLLRAVCRHFREFVTKRSIGDLHNYAIKHDNVNLLKIADELKYPWSQSSFTNAILADSLRCARYLNDGFCMIGKIDFTKDVPCSINALNLYSNIYEFCSMHVKFSNDCYAKSSEFKNNITFKMLNICRKRWTIVTARILAVYGTGKHLKFFIKKGGPHDISLLNFACYNINAECLQVLHNFGYKLNSDLYENAIKHESITCLNYLRKCNIQLSKEYLVLVAENGSVNLFRELMFLGITIDVIRGAISSGSIEIMQIILENVTINSQSLVKPAPLKENQTNIMIESNIMCQMFVDAFTNVWCDSCTEMADYLRQVGWTWCRDLYFAAATADNEYCMKYLFENDCPYFRQPEVSTSIKDVLRLIQKIYDELYVCCDTSCKDAIDYYFR